MHLSSCCFNVSVSLFCFYSSCRVHPASPELQCHTSPQGWSHSLKVREEEMGSCNTCWLFFFFFNPNVRNAIRFCALGRSHGTLFFTTKWHLDIHEDVDAQWKPPESPPDRGHAAAVLVCSLNLESWDACEVWHSGLERFTQGLHPVDQNYSCCSSSFVLLFRLENSKLIRQWMRLCSLFRWRILREVEGPAELLFCPGLRLSQWRSPFYSWRQLGRALWC